MPKSWVKQHCKLRILCYALQQLCKGALLCNIQMQALKAIIWWQVSSLLHLCVWHIAVNAPWLSMCYETTCKPLVWQAAFQNDNILLDGYMTVHMRDHSQLCMISCSLVLAGSHNALDTEKRNVYAARHCNGRLCAQRQPKCQNGLDIPLGLYVRCMNLGGSSLHAATAK